MTFEQSTRIAVSFAREVARSPSARLCGACVDVLAVSGAGITIMGGTRPGPACVSDTRMSALEDLQFMTGEGPCRDAFASGRPVHAPRLDGSAATRWPSFVDLAQVTGIAAVFAYPMATHGARVGVLTLYQDRAGDLSAAQNDDSIALVGVLAETFLRLQEEAHTDVLAAGLDDSMTYRAEIHQASGMVSVQLQIPVSDAMLRIRAFAFAQGLPIAAVAADIVGRHLRLTDDRNESGEEGPTDVR